MYRTILIPLDGSVLAEQALHELPHIAAQNAVVYLVQVIRPTAPEITPEGVSAPSLSHALEASQREALAYLKGAATELRMRGYQVRPEALVSEHPADAIATFASARGVDLIIMSTHGLGGLSKLVFGSVTIQVIRQAPCPVLVVRPS